MRGIGRDESVFEAADGPAAIDVWEKSPVHIDLLVTDMIMPKGISGPALAKTLVEKDPQLRAIFTSGFSQDFVEQDRSLIPEGRFLSKPYDPLTLLKTVKHCLNNAENAAATSGALSPA